MFSPLSACSISRAETGSSSITNARIVRSTAAPCASGSTNPSERTLKPALIRVRVCWRCRARALLRLHVYNHRLHDRCKLKVCIRMHTLACIGIADLAGERRRAAEAEIAALVAALAAIPRFGAGGYVTALQRRAGHRQRPRRPGRGRRRLPDRAAWPRAGTRRCSTSAARCWRRWWASATPACSCVPYEEPDGIGHGATGGARAAAWARCGRASAWRGRVIDAHGPADRRRAALADGSHGLPDPGARRRGRAAARAGATADARRARARPVHALLRRPAHGHLRRLGRRQVDPAVDDHRRHRRPRCW